VADDTIPPDLTLLGGQITEMGRDVRLMRLQVDNIAARLAAHDQRFTAIDQRFTAIDGRLGTVEQSIHELTGEMARGFGQQQQQLTRIEKRFDVVDAGLTALRDGMAENTKLLSDLLARG
jgi:hypothetical protein